MGEQGQVLDANESGSCSFPGQELRFVPMYTTKGVNHSCDKPLMLLLFCLELLMCFLLYSKN